MSSLQVSGAISFSTLRNFFGITNEPFKFSYFQAWLLSVIERHHKALLGVGTDFYLSLGEVGVRAWAHKF